MSLARCGHAAAGAWGRWEPSLASQEKLGQARHTGPTAILSIQPEEIADTTAHRGPSRSGGLVPRGGLAQQPTAYGASAVVMPWDEDDPEGERRYSAFTQALADLGWTDGRNVQMDPRWAAVNLDRVRM
jgi:hypothetical protein